MQQITRVLKSLNRISFLNLPKLKKINNYKLKYPNNQLNFISRMEKSENNKEVENPQEQGGEGEEKQLSKKAQKKLEKEQAK